MPFFARCRRCNWLTWATSRYILDICLEEHDIKSHKDYDTLLNKNYETWTVAIITHRDYSLLLRFSKIPAFWQAIRRSPARITPRFSGLIVGRISLYAN